MTNDLFRRLSAASDGRPDAPLAHMPDGSVVSYGAFWAAAHRVAAALLAAGLTPGDRVAVQAEKSLEMLQLVVGTVLAGGAILPLNTAYTAAELGYFLTDAEPRLFVCDPARAEALAGVAAAAKTKLLTLGADGQGTFADAVAAAPAGSAEVARGPDDLAAILYTSGTTGRSKGAMLSHDALASNSETLAKVWHWSADDVLIHALPVFHTHGLFVATNVTLIAGAAMIFQPKFDPNAVLDAMPRATALMGVPTFYTRLLDSPRLDRETAANMRVFISGSAPLLAETHDRWRARTGHAILERYGMTETNMNTSNPYDGERRAGTVGFPLPGVEVRVTGPDAAPLPVGEIGAIEVRGRNCFKGYWRMPEKTAEEIRPDGWFITGDLGTFSQDGYLTLVGRSKDLVITGGFNVYPKEVEELIDDLPGVVESAVFGLPHPDFGEAVAAVIVGTATEDEVIAALAERLARFKQPKRVFVVEALPRNTMGKVQKAALRSEYADTFALRPQTAG